MTKILQRLKVIETEQNEAMEELTEFLDTVVRDALMQLSRYLSTKNVRRRFTSWTLDDAPKAEMSWGETKSQIEKTLSRRLRNVIEQWEEDNKVFSNARESLLTHFRQRYDFVEEQLRILQGLAIDDNIGGPEVSDTDGDLPVAAMVLLGVGFPIWIPLCLVALVTSAPLLGIVTLAEKLEDKKMLKTFNKDRCAFMTKKSAEYLDRANNFVVLREFVNEQLREAKLCLQSIKASIPDLIDNDKKLYERLKHETRGKEQLLYLYQPVLDKASMLRGNLAVFGFKDVFDEDISCKKLHWEEDESHLLGRGAFGVVYKGTMTKDGANQLVALKLFNQVLHAKNACEILAEVELLR